MNTNDYVRVRLTERGKEIAREQLGIATVASDLQENNQGVSQWQLWHLMQVFGAHCYNGGPQIFIGNEVRFSGEISTWEREKYNRELQAQQDTEIGRMGGGG